MSVDIFILRHSSTISVVLIPTYNILSKVDLYLWMVRTDSADQIGKKKRTAICDPFCSRISTGFKVD